MQREVKYLDCHVDFHFEDDFIRFPIETKDGKVFEATFCDGYQERQYLVAPSTQMGCPSRCKFCELGDYGLIKNLSEEEILDEINIILNKAHKRNYDIFGKPIKLTFVMGGDALTNKYFGQVFERVSQEIPLKTKVSTIFPDSGNSYGVFQQIANVAKHYPNIVQFQVSLNSTDEKYRQDLVNIPLADFKKIRKAAEEWHDKVPNPRKINLTFTVSQETPLNPDDISDILTPDLFAIRLRPWVPTDRGKDHNLEELTNGKLEENKKKFEDAGYLYIPGKAGGVEYRFRVAPGEILKLYSQLRNNKQNSQKESSGEKQNERTRTFRCKGYVQLRS